MDMEKNLRVRGKKFVVTCMRARALMSVARCIYGNCFVGKYFVVCFSTTKNLPTPLRKIPAIRYAVLSRSHATHI